MSQYTPFFVTVQAVDIIASVSSLLFRIINLSEYRLFF